MKWHVFLFFNSQSLSEENRDCNFNRASIIKINHICDTFLIISSIILGNEGGGPEEHEERKFKWLLRRGRIDRYGWRTIFNYTLGRCPKL